MANPDNSDNSEQLANSLGKRHITMIALGGVVGAGFFVGSASAILKVGPAVFVSYMIAGLLIYLINLSIRDLALHGDGDSSFVSQIRKVLGRRVGFLAGWAYWLTWVIVLGAEVMAGASLLHNYIHIPLFLLELALLVVMTGVNLLSVKGYGEFEYWFSLTKLIAIGVFAGLAIWAIVRGNMGLGAPVPVTHNLLDFGGLLPKGWAAILAVIPTIVFSMTGSEIVTVAAMESNDPEGNIIRITRTLAIRIGGFYLVSIALILASMPWSNMRPTQSPFLLVLRQVGVPYADLFVWAVILVAVLSTLNSSLYVTSRVMYDMAESEDAPSFFLKIDPKSQLPRRAVLVSFVGALLVLLSARVSPDTMFALLLSLTGTLMLFNNLLIILARVKIHPDGQWAPRLACFLLACTFIAMLWVPETRSQAGLGGGAIVLISIIGALRYRKLPLSDM